MNTDQKFFAIQAANIKRIGLLEIGERQAAKIAAIKKINRQYSAVLINISEYRRLLNLIFAQ